MYTYMCIDRSRYELENLKVSGRNEFVVQMMR